MREPQYPAAKVPRCLVSAAPIKIPKIAADAVTHEAFDLVGWNADDAAYFGLALLQERLRDIVSVAHAALVRVGRAHPVAAVIEEAAAENSGRTLSRLTRQFTEACGWEWTPKYVVRDRDEIYGEIFTRRPRAMGIRDRSTAPRSPWQNGHTERLIVSLRRECLTCRRLWRAAPAPHAPIV